MWDILRNYSLPVTAICVIGLLLIAALTPAAVVDAGAQTAQLETDNTVTRIQVSPDGSAQWTIQIRTRLDTDSRVADYEAFQERFRENTSRYLDPFRTRMQGVVRRAANATGREMRAVNFTASTTIQEVPRRWGIVTYQFTWTGFAAPRNETLAVGDVFQGGFFLAANDTLEVEAPAHYAITSVDPAPASREDGVVTWVGREDFADGHPQVVFEPPTESTETGTRSATPAGPTTSSGDGWLPVVLWGVLLLALFGIGVYIGWRRFTRRGTEPDGKTSAGLEASDEGQEPTGEDAGVDETATGAGVMTDRERVQELLEANDGRIRQAAIAEEFDWSASKTSRIIGKMVDDGTVEKLQLGRENLIDLVDPEE